MSSALFKKTNQSFKFCFLDLTLVYLRGISGCRTDFSGGPDGDYCLSNVLKTNLGTGNEYTCNEVA